MKSSFLALRGLKTWNDQDSDWSERGFEHAAEVIAWALLDEEQRIFTVPNTQPESFAEAYTLLTRRAPPTR